MHARIHVNWTVNIKCWNFSMIIYFVYFYFVISCTERKRRDRKMWAKIWKTWFFFICIYFITKVTSDYYYFSLFSTFVVVVAAFCFRNFFYLQTFFVMHSDDFLQFITMTKLFRYTNKLCVSLRPGLLFVSCNVIIINSG